MEGVNKAILVGSVGADPEVRSLGDNKVLTTFRLATNRSYKNQSGEKKTDTTWHNIKAWGVLAENMGKLVKKGTNIFVEGEIQNTEYEKDGVKKYMTSVMVKNFTLLPSANRTVAATDAEPAAASVQAYKSETAQPAQAAQTVSASSADVMGGGDDDLPF